MVDHELRAISALLRANESSQQDFYRKQLPKSIFVVRIQEYDWVHRYREKYGRYPSAVSFAQKFNVKLPKVKDPLEAAIQPVMDASMKEQMRSVVSKTKKLIDDDVSLDKVIETFRGLANNVTSFSLDYTDIDLSKSEGALDRYRERVDAQLDKSKNILQTPWPTLNKVVKFMRGGEQVTLTARLGIGKSWLVCNWAHHYASQGVKVLVITKEMPSDQFEDRIDCLRYKIDYEAFRDGSLPPKELRRWREQKARDIRNKVDYPLIIVGKETIEGIGLQDIAAKCVDVRPQVVFVDGAYLIRPSELRADIGDVQRFTFLSNRFKSMAKYFKALFVLTVQDNREAEDKKGVSKGSIRSIYGADAWAQDSDYVINIGGKRGADERDIALLKGRESSLVEFLIGFKVEPPEFVDKGSPAPGALKKSTTLKMMNFKPIK